MSSAVLRSAIFPLPLAGSTLRYICSVRVFGDSHVA